MARGRRPRRIAAAVNGPATGVGVYHFPTNAVLPPNENHHANNTALAVVREPAFVPISEFPCYPCKQDFVEHELLKEHNELVHMNDKFGCGLCENKFEIPLDRKTHRITIHGMAH